VAIGWARRDYVLGPPASFIHGRLPHLRVSERNAGRRPGQRRRWRGGGDPTAGNAPLPGLVPRCSAVSKLGLDRDLQSSDSGEVDPSP
jgi:hypothetical protein